MYPYKQAKSKNEIFNIALFVRIIQRAKDEDSQPGECEEKIRVDT